MDADEVDVDALREAERELGEVLMFERDEKRVFTRVFEPEVEFSVIK